MKEKEDSKSEEERRKKVDDEITLFEGEIENPPGCISPVESNEENDSGKEEKDHGKEEISKKKLKLLLNFNTNLIRNSMYNRIRSGELKEYNEKFKIISFDGKKKKKTLVDEIKEKLDKKMI